MSHTLVTFHGMRNVGLDQAARRLAEQQHSVVSRSQVRHLGGDRWAVDRRVRSGEWEEATSQVLRMAGSRRTFRQRCMVAVLHYGEGTVISGRAAARLWGLPGFASPDVEMSRHRSRAMRRQGGLQAVLHRPRLLPPHHCTGAEGIPVTTVARTVFDLAGCLQPGRTERALDNALTRRLVTLETIRGVTIELLEHGRTGSGLMRQLLMARGAGYIPPESGLEARFLAVLAQAGIETPSCQVDLGAESWIGRVDHLFRRWHIVAEVDSELHHSSKLDRESDARRDAALRAAGFEVLRFTDEQVWEHPEKVVTEVRSAIADAERRKTADSSFEPMLLPRSGSGNVVLTATLSLPER